MPMNNDSSWGSAREDRLDRAIDRAVREMMHVDPRPGMRLRVLARLNAPAERRSWMVPRPVFAVAALAILIVSYIALNNRPVTIGDPVAGSRAATSTPPTPAQARTDSVVQQARGNDPRSRPAAPRVTRERIPMPRVSNVFGARSTQVSAATDRAPGVVWIDTPVRSTAAPIETIEPITIAPLQTSPIVIEPLIRPKGGQ